MSGSIRVYMYGAFLLNVLVSDGVDYAGMKTPPSETWTFFFSYVEPHNELAHKKTIRTLAKLPADMLAIV